MGTNDDSETQAAEFTPRSRLRNASLPSRVGENLYWLGRYATRCEDKIRLLRGTLTLERRSEVWPITLKLDYLDRSKF